MPPEPGKPTPNNKSTPGMKALGEDKSGQKKSNSEMALQECSELEEELASLRATYEQYFLGNERLPPTRAHEDLKKRLNRLKGGLVRNTAAKFRLNSLQNKFLTYERLWQRTLQEIEAGTYKRDLFKAKRRAQKAQTQAGGEKRKEAFDLTEEISDDDLEEVADIVPNEPLPTKVARPTFIPQPVEPVPSGTPFRGTPVVAPVPVVPAVVPTVAPVAGTPFRGTPSVAPVAGTPSKGSPTIPPVSTPARGVPSVPPGATPSKGTPTLPPGGAPARGVPAFGSPAQSGGGIAAALESLTDEPLTSAPAAAARPSGTAAPRPGAVSTGPRPGTPAAGRPAAAPAAATPRPAGAPASNLSDDKLRAVYDAYVTAKKRNQEDTSKMNFESVAANLRKQVPELLKQHGAKSVEFKVVIKDGKATLKAVPK